jgi:hypothetical protein
MKFRYVVKNLRAIADQLEDDLEAGDMEGCIEELGYIQKLIKEALQYVGERS